MDPNSVISINKASRELNISRTQVYRLVERGILIEVSIGDRKMIDIFSIKRYKELREKIREIEKSMKIVHNQ